MSNQEEVLYNEMKRPTAKWQRGVKARQEHAVPGGDQERQNMSNQR